MLRHSLAALALFVATIGVASASTTSLRQQVHQNSTYITARQAERDAKQAVGGGRVRGATMYQSGCGIEIYLVTIDMHKTVYSVYLYATTGGLIEITQQPKT